MADPALALRVNGKEFGGWKSVRVTRGIESVAGSFELSVSERWANQDQPWEIAEEDECTVVIGGVPVITGYVDKRAPAYTKADHSLTIAGRDRTGDLVDCSALLSHWEFKNTPVLTLAKRIAEPYGIAVSLQSGLVLPATPAKLSIDPGDSAFEAIERACKSSGLLPVSDGAGGLVLTRAGSKSAVTKLVQGQNILNASAEFTASGRFRTYRVLGQHRGNDEFFGSAAGQVKATATDLNVRRSARTLLIRPEGNVTIEHAKRRAEWEASVRRARAASFSVTVQGWTQGDGTLWPVNALVWVLSPWLKVDAQLLITEVVYSKDEGGTFTTLTLKHRNSFKPEPTIAAEPNGYWPEIVRGV